MGLIESRSQLLAVTKQWTTVSVASGSAFETGFTPVIFTADRPYQVVSVTERHEVQGSSTIMLVGALGSTPIGSGLPLLASTISTFSAIDVFQTGTLLGSAVLTGSSPLGTTATGPVLAQGDGLGVRYTTAGATPPVGVLTVILQTI